MQIDLSEEERSLLREVLEAANSDLSEEIYKTENADYKRLLKQREQTLGSLMRKVTGG